MRGRLVLVSLAVVGVALSHRVASAQSVDTRRTPVVPHSSSALTGSLVTLGSGVRLFLFTPTIEQRMVAGSWRGGVLLDEPFRGAFRLSAVDAQEIARVISDVSLMATVFQAAAIDATLVPLVQGDPDLAWQASAAYALALGLTLSVGQVIKLGAGRARPYSRECADDPSRPGCTDGQDTYQSFYSLHTGVAFTSAGFSCAMHASRGLYDDDVADGASCAVSVAMATTTGMLRVLSDRHYLSDVLVGALTGFLVGYLVPLALVPERGEQHAGHREAPDVTWAVAPLLSTSTSSTSGQTVGASVFGTF
ncbi:phosphatase PAP2 family protein [Sandaracinus amylolyticus]|uniref:phosphatase PAP2 family protein n=1 Tax=Sandaracinus amylolyticus TaxID=927083 RepID=UPI0012ECE94B|nr:phosphatase PAP2 family protein [Sandaracinus amylolyticus]